MWYAPNIFFNLKHSNKVLTDNVIGNYSTLCIVIIIKTRVFKVDYIITVLMLCSIQTPLII